MLRCTDQVIGDAVFDESGEFTHYFVQRTIFW